MGFKKKGPSRPIAIQIFEGRKKKGGRDKGDLHSCWWRRILEHWRKSSREGKTRVRFKRGEPPKRGILL